MALIINQFAMERNKGNLTGANNFNIIKCRVDVSEAGSVFPGDAVEIVGTTEGIISVKLATSLTSNVFGFVDNSIRKEFFVAKDLLNIGIDQSIMFMEASAAIDAGAEIQFDPSTKKVATRVAPNTISGIAFEKAAGDGVLLPVYIISPVAIPDELSLVPETILAAGALSAALRVSNLELVGAGAVTLAAPDSSMLGLVKAIEMTVDNGNVTLALTNVQGGSAGTTCTWANVGEQLVLVAGASKWTVIGEGGVVLS